MKAQQPTGDKMGPSPWGKLQGVHIDVVHANTISTSPTANILSLLFKDLSVQLDPGEKGAPLGRMKAVAVQVPVTVPDEADFVGYVNQFRGSVMKTKGARVTLIADIAGTTHVMEFPFGDEVTADDQRGNFMREFFSLDRRGPKGTEPEFRQIGPYTLTLLLRVERRAKDDLAVLNVDTLDVVAVNAAQQKPAQAVGK